MLMQKIGAIRLLQAQERSLKREGADGREVYDPDGIINLNELRLTPFGIVGILDMPRGEMPLLDVHHLRHPHSRFRGDNKISLGFTSHYAAMRSRFGVRPRDGQAGENIIVKSKRLWTPDDLGARLLLRSRDANRDILLCQILPIPPCEPFARFARGGAAASAADAKADLRFLADGMRGYYMEIESADSEAVARLGDRLYLID